MEKVKNVIEKLVDRVGQKELQILTIGTGTSLVVAILIAFFSQNIVIGDYQVSTILQAIIAFVLFTGLTVFQSLRVLPMSKEVTSRGNRKTGEGGEDLEETSSLAQLGDIPNVVEGDLENIDDKSKDIILELIKENRRLQKSLSPDVATPARLTVEEIKDRLPLELQELYDSLPGDMRLEIQKIYGIISEEIKIQREVSLAELENEQYIAPKVRRNYPHRRKAESDENSQSFRATRNGGDLGSVSAESRSVRQPERKPREEEKVVRKARKPRKRLERHKKG